MPTGRVTSFDAHRGLGEVTADDGRPFPFHCTAIADGSRTIETGTAVSFEPARKLGRWEATAVAAIAPT
jgi:cold shock CspA family protein